MDNTSVSYIGTIVFIGIDMHHSLFILSCLCEGAVAKRCRIPASAEAVIGFVSKHLAQRRREDVLRGRIQRLLAAPCA